MDTEPQTVIKYIDVCSGIGGFHSGMVNHKCILACDINKACRESYKTNYNIECEKDIFDININNLDDFNILCAGFPCQPFSSAGLKKGLEDTRSKVYDKLLNIIEEKRPDILLLENVKNLLVINKGEVIKTIVSDLENLNYSVSYSILNTCNFGLAQNRERVYFVCLNKNIYGFSKFDFNKLVDMKIKRKLKDIIDFNNKNYIPHDTYVLLKKEQLKEQKSGLIFCGYIKGSIRKKGTLVNTNHYSRVHRQPNRIYHINGVHPTLSSSESTGRYFIYDGVGVRKMNIKECFKIMGFPETYILHEKPKENYSQIGNSVSPILIGNINRELISQGFIQNIRT